MIRKANLLEKYLNYLLLVLFPTQLAKHFWPSFSLIYGIRIDYYSIAIYLTDIIFVILFIIWATRTFRDRSRDIYDNRYLILIFVLIAILNIVFSTSVLISIFKWLKILEYLLLSYYVYKRTDIFNKLSVGKYILISVAIISLVGILQVLRGQTTSRLFYLLGERSFSIFTPGIAITNIFGLNILRMYSTFPHPNALAGFVVVSVIFIVISKKFILKPIEKIILLFALISTCLTFSLSSVVGVIAVMSISIVFRKHIFDRKLYFLLIIFYAFLSMSLSIFSSELINHNLFVQQSFKERLQLADFAGRLLPGNWILGTGLNTFIKSVTTLNRGNVLVWLLQPVHNIFLLIFTETGVAGIIVSFYLLYSYINKMVIFKNKWALAILIFILTTSLFDHYWFTIQQNMLLMSLMVGLSLQEK